LIRCSFEAWREARRYVVKFLCEQCKAKYQIADEKAVGKTVRMKCRKCGHLIEVRAAVTETSVSSPVPVPSASGATQPQEGQAPAPPAQPVATAVAAAMSSWNRANGTIRWFTFASILNIRRSADDTAKDPTVVAGKAWIRF